MKLGIAICILTQFAFTALAFVRTQPGGQKQTFDGVAFYKNNCVGCHGSKAQKKFNPDLPEGQMVDAILNGLPMGTPPDLPGFAKKGNQRRASQSHHCLHEIA